MSQEIRLMIVDDHQFFRECLASLLSEKGGFTVVDLSGDLETALIKVKAHRPDVVLIDAHLPDNSALELTRQVNLEEPQVKLIVFGLDESEPIVLKCAEAGIRGYIRKEASLDDLMTVIRSVHREETVCSPRIAYSMFSRVSELARGRGNGQAFEFLDLTTREVEILRLMSDGLSNKQIAGRLYLSLYTIKNHVHNILEKLQVRNRSGAVRYALERGLLRKSYPRERETEKRVLS